MMVDKIDSYFSSPIMSQQQDDGGSTVYASTDNGWTIDDESDAGKPALLGPAAPAPAHSVSSNLIDFDSSDNGDTPYGNDLAEKILNATDQECGQYGTENTSKGVQSFALGPSSQAQSESNLDPVSAEFTPGSPCSFSRLQALPLSPSSSSYVDACQSLGSSDDRMASLQTHVKQLEHDHETLKGENNNLCNVNMALRHRAEMSQATIEKLEAQISEAELLRCRAQKYALEITERGNLDQESLDGLHKELGHYKTQLERLKTKYAKVAQNQESLLNRLQELQTGLLNAVERNKTYEAFLHVFLTDHPEHVAAFETIGVSPGGANQDSIALVAAEAEPLISFGETSSAPVAANEPSNGGPSHNTKSFLEFQPHPALTAGNPRSKYTVSPQQDLQQIPLQPGLYDAEISKPQTPQSSEGDLLKWKDGCNDIWESSSQRELALRNHQGATGSRQPSQTPGMFLYGIRYTRRQNDQPLITIDGVLDVASRTVIMTGLPDEVHVQRVLEHVRGGRVLNAHTVPMGTGDVSYNHAYVEFTATEDASAFFRYTRCREFGFIEQDGASVRVHTTLPATDSYPLNENLQGSIDKGSTRCLSVTGFPVMHLAAVLKLAGMAHNFTEVITHFAYSDDGSFEISFASLKSAILVRNCVLGSSLYTGSTDGRGVIFRPDPCDAPLADLRVPFLPTYPTSDFSFLSSENAQQFMTAEERETEEERLRELMFEGCDPNDPDIIGLKEMNDRKNIVWEKSADWDNAIEFMAFDPDQRKEVLHRRDRESGAVQVWYHGGWAMNQHESWKAWEHHNIDSTHPYTQKTADLLYAVTGWIDRRKIVVDDGGLHGNADQTLNPALDKPADEWTETMTLASTAPLLSDLTRVHMSFDDSSTHVPVGVYCNQIGSNSGVDVPLRSNRDLDTDNIVPNTSSESHSRIMTLATHVPSSPSLDPVISEGFEGTIHGISKPVFNRLTARIAKDKTKSPVKKPQVGQAPF